MTFWKAFYLGPVAVHLTKNIIRIPSSWICILAEFTGTHYIPHLLKHWSADPEQNCRLHFPRKYMQIVIYLPINAYTGLSHNMDSALKELFPNLQCRVRLKNNKKNLCLLIKLHVLSFVVYVSSFLVWSQMTQLSGSRRTFSSNVVWM